MQDPLEIRHVGFKSPVDPRLEVEAVPIEELKQRAPAEHFDTLQRADFFRLLGVLEGQTRPMVDFSTFEVKAGGWLLVRPGQVFRHDFSTDWQGWLLVFRPEGLAVWGRDEVGKIDLARLVEDLPLVCSLDTAQNEWMVHTLRQLQVDGVATMPFDLRKALLQLQLVTLLTRMALWQSRHRGLSAVRPVENAHFRRFRQLLERDFAKRHQVQEYARVLGVSEKTLSRMCLALAGVPAKAFIHQRLALEAKRMLAHTRLAVSVIGGELGFDESSNFVKFFRKETGLTPQAFRKTL